VSHLPHAAAAAVAAAAPEGALGLAGGAFRDVTRVASADGALWSAIFLANRAELLEAVDGLCASLERFRTLLESGDREGLEAWWAEGRRRRERYLERAGAGGARG
jgi:prephenate dehydrogenase